MIINNILEELQEKKIKLGDGEPMPYSLLTIMHDEISRKEIAHSKIIASLLTPTENHGYNYDVAILFLKLIEIEDFKPEEIEEFKVVTEEHIKVADKNRFIDILITWKKETQNFAVIIENKLNYAIDQKNQLNEYYDSIEKKGFEIKKIVYMHPNKSANQILDIKDDVRKKIKDFNIGEMIHWLDECIKKTNSEKKHHLISYRDLLKSMNNKHRNFMKAKEIQENLSDDKLKKIINLASIVSSDDWHNAKYALLKEKLPNELKEKLIVNPKGKYAEFFFRPYKYWIELWMHEYQVNFYICSYAQDKEIKILEEKFEFNCEYGGKYYYRKSKCSYKYPEEREELLSELAIILKDLSKYKG